MGGREQALEGLLEEEKGGEEQPEHEAKGPLGDPWQVLEGRTDLFEREE